MEARRGPKSIIGAAAEGRARAIAEELAAGATANDACSQRIFSILQECFITAEGPKSMANWHYVRLKSVGCNKKNDILCILL